MAVFSFSTPDGLDGGLAEPIVAFDYGGGNLFNPVSELGTASIVPLSEVCGMAADLTMDDRHLQLSAIATDLELTPIHSVDFWFFIQDADSQRALMAKDGAGAMEGHINLSVLAETPDNEFRLGLRAPRNIGGNVDGKRWALPVQPPSRRVEVAPRGRFLRPCSR